MTNPLNLYGLELVGLQACKKVSNRDAVVTYIIDSNYFVYKTAYE